MTVTNKVTEETEDPFVAIVKTVAEPGGVSSIYASRKFVVRAN